MNWELNLVDLLEEDTTDDRMQEIVKLMPPLPYDWIKASFHYTLLEDLVILCCMDEISRE